MRKNLLCAGLLLVSFTSIAANAPFQPKAISNFSQDKGVGKDFTRLKISLIVSDPSDINSIRLGGLTVCSNSTCFKPTTPDYFRAMTTSGGASALIVDAVIPATSITSVYFEPSTGKNIVDGSIKLEKPLLLEKGYYGGEILLSLSKKNVLNQSIYYPSDVSSNLFNIERQSIYYNPKNATRVNLKYGASLMIPAGALNKPQIFSVAVHDIGKNYPLVDIYPYINLNKPISLERVVIGSSNKNTGIKTPSTPDLNPLPKSSIIMRSNSSSDKSITSLSKTGVVDDITSNTQSSSISSNQAISLAAASPTCDQIISANLAYLLSFTATNGAVHVNWCQNIAPYVNIIVVNTNDSRIRYSIPLTTGYNPASKGYQIVLKPITDYAPNTIATINGFTWSGDQGTSSGQFGVANGYLFSAGIVYGRNQAGGGSIGGSGVSDGNKFVMGYGANLNTLTFFETSVAGATFGSYSRNVVSSSTSVIKNNNCTSDLNNNRWSAVGAKSGRMVMISSTSGGSTTAAQLCPVFRALEIQNALRLDGGPSTSMTLDGKLLNPITGVASIKYGSVRHVAYPLKISW